MIAVFVVVVLIFVTVITIAVIDQKRLGRGERGVLEDEWEYRKRMKR